MERAEAKAIVSGRPSEVGGAASAPAAFERPTIVQTPPVTGRRSRVAGALAPALVLAVALTVILAVVAAPRPSPARPAARTAAVALPTPGSVTFGGVAYRLLGITTSKTIPQPGGATITASGLFEIVRLRLAAADRRGHLVTSDLLALTAGGTYYGVSNPDDIGLSSTRWGALAPTTTVPASGALTVRAIFDVPPGVLAHHPWLRIGQFAYVGQAPAQILRLADTAACCVPARQTASQRRTEQIGQLVPSPVLG